MLVKPAYDPPALMVLRAIAGAGPPRLERIGPAGREIGGDMSLQAQSALGLVAIPLIAWLLSEQRTGLAPARMAHVVLAGVGLQLLVAGIMLNVAAVRVAFDWAAGLVAA